MNTDADDHRVILADHQRMARADNQITGRKIIPDHHHPARIDLHSWMIAHTGRIVIAHRIRIIAIPCPMRLISLIDSRSFRRHRIEVLSPHRTVPVR